jgi:hypothetical protein
VSEPLTVTVLDARTREELQPPCERSLHPGSGDGIKCGAPAEWIVDCRCGSCDERLTKLYCNGCLQYRIGHGRYSMCRHTGIVSVTRFLSVTSL